MSDATYRTLLLDPPWAERGGGKIKRGADRHYDVATTPKILNAVLESGVWRPASPGASVWMWATVNFLPDALWLMDKLGARYVTNAVWVKATPVGDGRIQPQAPGLGQRMRVCHEHLLFGRIGKVPVPAPQQRLPSTIYAPRTKHSAKPPEVYSRIEQHDGPGARCELFARNAYPGWDAWGNEAPK